MIAVLLLIHDAT